MRRGSGSPHRLLARRGVVLGLVLVAACAGRSATDATPARDTVALRGADVSALERIEQGGGVFRDGGQPGDAIAILRAHGVNLFRLRLFVNPDGDEVQVNDLDYTVRLAEIEDLETAVASVPGGRGTGVVWWYPEAIEVPGIFVWGGGSLSLFDAGGNVCRRPARSRHRDSRV